MHKTMNCPACGAASTEKIGVSGIYSLMACKDCTVEFWDPLKHPGELFYETSDLHAITGERSLQWRHRFFLENPPLSGDILDVGCGTGEFLAQCRDKGFSVWGVDIAERNIIEAARRHGITTVFKGTLADFVAAHPDKKFDVITFFEIVEHLADPIAFFNDVKKALKLDGKIVMSVPNLDRFGGPIEKEETPPNHLFRWRAPALRRFLGRLGFHDVRIMLQPLSSEFFLVRGWFSFGFMKKIRDSKEHYLFTAAPASPVGRFRRFLLYGARIKSKLAYPLAVLMALPLRLLGMQYWDMYATAALRPRPRKEIHEGHKARYAFAREYVRGKKVIDVACGFGTGSNMLAETAHSVVGVDLSDEELSFARESFVTGNLSFMKEDATKMPFPDNSFDIAVSFETIEHLSPSEQVAFLEEIRRVVVPSGTVLLSTPDHYVWQRLALHWDQHRKELTKKELLDILGRFFSVTAVWAQWILKEEPFARRIIRGFLNAIKRLDWFGWRYSFVPRGIRKGIDAATTPVDMGRWDLIPVHGEETGAHIVVACINDKKSAHEN